MHANAKPYTRETRKLHTLAPSRLTSPRDRRFKGWNVLSEHDRNMLKKEKEKEKKIRIYIKM